MNYWKRRQQQLNKQLEKDEEKLKKRLSSYFDAEYRKLEKDIAAYYEQYGIDHVIQYRNLMEELPEADKRLLMEQMDEFAEKYPEYASLMPVRESIYRLNRLEGLQYSIRMQQLEIGAIENEQILEHLQRNAERGVNAAAETMGFGKNFYANHPDIARLFVDKAWSDGENFSQKIWNNTSKLANYLNTDIAHGFARGDSYERLTRKLRERFGKVSRNDAYRLIYTEGTYIMAEATMQPFTDDFEQYRLSTAADGKVCSTCRSIAQEVFDIFDRQPGINFPPLHPWCRCTFTIEVNNWDAWMDEYEKRHSDGQAKKIASRLKSDIIDITDEEKYALNEYKSFRGFVINEQLRKNGKDRLSKEDKAIVNHLDSFLRKMPQYEGNLSRSLLFENDQELNGFLDEHEIGETVSYAAYTSTRKKVGLHNEKGQVQIFIADSKKGRDVSAYGPEEYEVLYERNQSFKVINRAFIDGKWNILLKEVE
ncbi:minor capsid protein [Anaerostipes faecalis]|uniref:minor capsid protein n=1 Tax=Anaerostipes faecalis TaxID=2738446 RepID=UPI003F0591E9